VPPKAVYRVPTNVSTERQFRREVWVMTFEGRIVVSRNTSNSLWIICIRCCQDKVQSMKIVIHEVFDEELMIPAVVALKNFKSPIPELKDLVMLRLRISRSLDTVSKKSFQVQVRIWSIQIIDSGLICDSM
jgi:hypothetical protein